MQVKEKERTISLQTRLDARDVCLLVEAFPSLEELSNSAICRFYLESAASALRKHGAARPVTIAEAIERLGKKGFSLKQLNANNPESRRTMRAIEKEEMTKLLTEDIRAIMDEEDKPLLPAAEVNNMEEIMRKIMEEEQ